MRTQYANTTAIKKPIQTKNRVARTRRQQPGMDRLETRCLLSTTVNEFSVGPRVPFPVGIVQSSANLDFYATEAGTGKLAQINHQTQAITEIDIPTADSGPFGITAAPDGTIWFTEALANKIGKYDPTTQTFTEYDIPTAQSFPWGVAVGNDGNVYFTEEFADRIGVLNPKTGNIVDNLPGQVVPFDPKGIVAGPAGDNKLYFVDGQDMVGSLAATNDASGNVISVTTSLFALPGNRPDPFGITVGPDGKVWFTETNGSAIGRWDQTNTATFTVDIFDLPSDSSVPLSIVPGAGGKLYFTDFATNAIGAIDATTHAFSAVSLTSTLAGPFTIAADASDGSVWFTEALANQVGHLAANSTLSEFPLPNATGGPFGMTTSTDGKLWFTESASSTLDRIDPLTHAVTTIPTPTPGSRPLGITAGPNGTVYFTEGAGKIGVYDASKPTPITEYTIPTPNSGPLGVTAGPGNTVWFTESIGNKIGKLDLTSGTFTEYPIATPFSIPSGIALGSDGNFWFTEAGGGKVGRLNPNSGAINEYALPTDFNNPTQIVAGPDGNLWFTEFGQNLGMINPNTGATSQFSVTGGFGGSLGLAVGPDGNLYLSELFGSQIVAFNPTTQTSTGFTIPTALSGPIGITSGPDGNVWFAEYLAGNVGQIKFPIATTTQFRGAIPNPSTFGQSVQFGVEVSPNTSNPNAPLPTGFVTFTIDGQDQPPQPVIVTTSGSIARLTISTLSVGQHTVVARYDGDSNFSPSPVSNPWVQTVLAAGAAPQVVGVQRLGYHMQPTSIVITFSEALDPTRARDLANYQLVVAGQHHPIRLVAATYDPASFTVTLQPGRLLPLKLRYRLTVVGTPPGGVTSAEGQFLDGSGHGQPGTNYTTVITRRNLLLNPAHTTAVPHGPGRHMFHRP